MKGYVVGILELSLFMIGSIFVRKSFQPLQSINKITYFWVMMTILTGFWEIAYISYYKHVVNMSSQLIRDKEHVWTNDIYNITYVLPWKLSHIFYSEYGAWADREYMSNSDDWSRIIESSHCTQCALFSLIAIIFKIYGNHNNYLISLSVSMGTQFMNSFLYMFAYFIQEKNPDNVNFANSSFPSDPLLVSRPFMWVNIFWLVMPFYTITYYLLENCNKDKNNLSEYPYLKKTLEGDEMPLLNQSPPPYIENNITSNILKNILSDNSFNIPSETNCLKVGTFSKYAKACQDDSKKCEKEEFNVVLKSKINNTFKIDDDIFISDKKFENTEKLGKIVSFGVDFEGDLQVNYIPERDLNIGLLKNYSKDSIIFIVRN